MNKTTTTLAALGLATIGVAGIAGGTASAHTPAASATCADGVTINLANYEAPAYGDSVNNDATLYLDGAVYSTIPFATDLHVTVPWQTVAESHAWRLVVDANITVGDPTAYDVVLEGSVDGCTVPTTTTPPDTTTPTTTAPPVVETSTPPTPTTQPVTRPSTPPTTVDVCYEDEPCFGAVDACPWNQYPIGGGQCADIVYPTTDCVNWDTGQRWERDLAVVYTDGTDPRVVGSIDLTGQACGPILPAQAVASAAAAGELPSTGALSTFFATLAVSLTAAGIAITIATRRRSAR